MSHWLCPLLLFGGDFLKIGDVIAHVDRIKPNSFDVADKLIWINEVEGLVQTEVMLIAVADMVEYTPETDLSTELLLRSPHDKVYRTYLAAMIDYANGEYNRYANTVEVFNMEFAELSCWYADKYRPADGGMIDDGYYITAYGIAVKRGYRGTEEEWLESLKGKPGSGGNGIDIPQAKVGQYVVVASVDGEGKAISFAAKTLGEADLIAYVDNSAGGQTAVIGV